MKTILSATLILMSALFCHAQRVSIIPRAGVSIHTFAKDTYYDYIPKNGTSFAGGIAASIRLSKKGILAIQPEVLFLIKGAKLIDTPLDGLVTADDAYRLKYLEMPLLLKLSSNPGEGKSIFFINAGPSFGICLEGTFEVFDRNNQLDLDKYEMDITFDYHDDRRSSKAYLNRRSDVSLQLGGGWSYPLGPVNVIVEVRYGHGLREFRNDDLRPGARMANRFWLFSAGVQIPGSR
ncbi:MAG: porin family protein [Cyclobacteriaceae bacterium]